MASSGCVARIAVNWVFEPCFMAHMPCRMSWWSDAALGGRKQPRKKVTAENDNGPILSQPPSPPPPLSNSSDASHFLPGGTYNSSICFICAKCQPHVRHKVCQLFPGCPMHTSPQLILRQESILPSWEMGLGEALMMALCLQDVVWHGHILAAQRFIQFGSNCTCNHPLFVAAST